MTTLQPPDTSRPAHSSRRRGLAIASGVALGLLLAGCDSRLSPEEHLRRAEAALAAGDVRTAWVEGRNALAATPDDPRARLTMGLIQLSAGSVEGARKEFDRALALGLTRGELELPYARTLLMQGDHERLAAWTAGVADETPAEVQAALLGLQAQGQLAQGKVERAREGVAAARERASGVPDVEVAAAMLQLADRELEAARATLEATTVAHPDFAPAWRLLGGLRSVANDLQGAEAAYTRVIEVTPNHSTALSQRGFLRVALGNLDGALADASALQARFGAAGSSSYLRGLVAFRQEDHEGARTLLREALAARPELHTAKVYLAASQLALGETAQTEALLVDALKAMPNHIDARRMLTGVLMLRGDFEAVVELLSPVPVEALDAALLEALGKAQVASGRATEGLANLKRAETQGADPARVQAAIGITLLGSEEPEQGVNLLKESLPGLDGDPAAQGRIILALLRVGARDRALAAARALVAADPQSADSLLMLATVHRAGNEVDEARAAYESIIQIRPADRSARHGLAELARLAGRPEEARGHYEAVLAAHPEHERTVLSLVELDSAAGDQAAAHARLKAYLAKHPTSADARLMHVNYLLGQGDAQAALGEVEKLAREYPRSVPVLRLQGEALSRVGRPAEAVGVYRQLAETEPGNPDYRYRLAQAQAAAGANSESLATLQALLAQHPEHVPAQVARLRGLAGSGRVDEARTLLDGLRERFPDSAELEAQSAWLAGLEGDRAAALASLERAYGGQRGGRLARELALAYLQADRTEEALAVLRQSLEEQPADSTTRTLLGLTLCELGQMEEGLQALRQVVEDSPQDAAALNNLAWMLVDSDAPAARALAEKAYRLSPDDSAILDTYARSLTAAGEAPTAQRLLKDALVRRPNEHSVRLSLANALLADGKRSEAQAEVEKVLSREPGNPGALVMRRRLAE